MASEPEQSIRTRVAEKVMGWTLSTDRAGMPIYIKCDGSTIPRYLWHPDTNIADAMMMLAEMKRRGWCRSLSDTVGNGPECRLWRNEWPPEGPQGKRRVITRAAKTEPLAASLAALAAVEE